MVFVEEIARGTSGAHLRVYLDRFAHWMSGKRRRPTGEIPAVVPHAADKPADAGTRAAD